MSINISFSDLLCFRMKRIQKEILTASLYSIWIVTPVVIGFKGRFLAAAYFYHSSNSCILMRQKNELEDALETAGMEVVLVTHDSATPNVKLAATESNMPNYYADPNDRKHNDMHRLVAHPHPLYEVSGCECLHMFCKYVVLVPYSLISFHLLIRFFTTGKLPARHERSRACS
jgi:hypothetical protein